MRAVVQGLDLRASWDRYLRIEGEHVDVRRVRSTIKWIKEAFAAAAHRHSKHGTARLVLLEADGVATSAAASTVPDLATFAAERGLEDFSTAEQLEEYTAAYGDVASDSARLTRRARLVRRQLEALRWLEELVSQEPTAADGVSAWFAPEVAERLERAGLVTLYALVQHINGVGLRWWARVPGIGSVTAARIVEWLKQHEPSVRMSVGHHVAVKRSRLKAEQLNTVVAKATSIVPFEKFLLPTELDGSNGRFRSFTDCQLDATNDYQAIAAWLRSKHDPNGTGRTATLRAYRREAERLLLWAILERRKPLSSLAVEDADAFKLFLSNPPPHWCGPRHHQRWSPLWRPLEGPLSAAALRQAVVILRSLFNYLVRTNYLTGNAFAAVSLPRNSGRTLGSRRALTFGQWDALEARLDEICDTAVGRRRARAIRWLYSTGLRLSELVAARCGHLQHVDYRLPDGTEDAGWLLEVVGKGDKVRQVPVPDRLMQELQDELRNHALSSNVLDESNRELAILCRIVDGEPRAISGSGVSKAIKAELARCASTMDEKDAQQLRRASAHWFRHTHGSHALNGRPGEGGAVPLQIVQNNLGHASLGTTSIYLTTERDSRLAAMKRFGERKQ